jgi:hypothetical protein
VAFKFYRTGELPHHDVAHVEGVDEVLETNPFLLDDDLHPKKVAEPPAKTDAEEDRK